LKFAFRHRATPRHPAGRFVFRLLGVCLVATGACVAPPAAHGFDSPYLAELELTATRRNLAQHPVWQRLLHYRANTFGDGVHSLVDEPGFFLAPDGAVNPQAELDATLRAFVSGGSAACRFVARHAWLAGQLQFDPARLPPPSCPDYERWRAQLPIEGVTLIFASAFLNNPPSMFGHTLLRLDSVHEDDRTRLLAHSVNYAAVSTDARGLLYAFRGLTGGYAGKFSLAPYYVKVQEYNDIEHRDLWEYRLALAPEEVDRLLQHLWELVPAHFDYYFFDENCSYHLLALLEAARPDLDLTSEFRFWTIPADTVRAVARQPGLVRDVVFRPARAAGVRARAATLDENERRLAGELGRGAIVSTVDPVMSLTPPRRAEVLELAHEFARLRAAANPSQVDPVSAELLHARSQLPPGAPPSHPVPAGRPEEGHASARLALGGGRSDGHRYTEIRWRPAYHDLLDDERGFTRGAQVQFFDTAIRHRADGGTRLEELQLVDGMSLVPRDEFIDAVSWRAQLGWRRQRLADGAEPLVFRAQGGPGFTVERGGSLLFALVEGALETESRYRRGYALGAGVAGGWLLDVTPAWRVSVEADAGRFGAGEVRSYRRGTLRQRISLGRNLALRIDVVREREFDESRRELAGAVLLYY
jgi:hypothetical protein